MKQKRPLFLLLLGVEGSGHHMLMAFLKHFFKSQNVVQHGEWHPYFFNRWDSLEKIQKATRLPLKGQTEIKPEVERIINGYSSQSELLYSGVSFPYGLDRDTLRRPDIIDIFELLEPHVEIRPLIIYRDPVSCAYSALRRKFNDNAIHQARIVEDNLIYIKQQLEACALDYRTISYEKFITNPDDYAHGYQQWWNISDESYSNGHAEIRKSTSKKEIPTKIAKQLEEFFSPLRVKQWDAFLQQKDIASYGKK